ncbi:hypothetical protein [Rubrivivax gelatinosus]|uniref:hypothetical protein n=1 Tax=Rubrivivax gelatinosus TaxID=28068 RepID=UPI00130DCC62|nr:hypothetical protein [Rubrivivax gelatinosus]
MIRTRPVTDAAGRRGAPAAVGRRARRHAALLDGLRWLQTHAPRFLVAKWSSSAGIF